MSQLQKEESSTLDSNKPLTCYGRVDSTRRGDEAMGTDDCAKDERRAANCDSNQAQSECLGSDCSSRRFEKAVKEI